MDSNTTTYTKTFSIDLERTNYHRKQRHRKRKRIIIVLIVWLVLFVYMFTPLSRVNLSVSGNVYYTKKDLVKMGHIPEKRLWWLFDEDDAIKVLESYEFINDVKIKKSLFGTKMIIDEIYPVGVKNDKYVMNDNTLINKENYSVSDKVLELASFDNVSEEDISALVNKYSKISLSIREDFYKVEIVKGTEDYSYVKLYGNRDDVGYFVIKADLVYLDNKFKGNKYSKIIGKISENNVKYSGDEPCLVAYHEMEENKFTIVDEFEEEKSHE